MNALEIYGRDYKKIQQIIGTKTLVQTSGYGYCLVKRFKADSTLKGAHLLDVLGHKLVPKWTKREDEKFEKAFEEYGSEKWDKISRCVGTKNGSQTKYHAKTLG